MGVITYGVNSMFLKEVKELFVPDLDILSLAFTNPLPQKLIRKFAESISGGLYVVEDGYRYLQKELMAAGIKVSGKEKYSRVTEWTPASIAAMLGFEVKAKPSGVPPVPRPPMICAVAPTVCSAGKWPA